MFPSKLVQGSVVRVITPSRSLSMPWITSELQERAKSRLEDLGLQVSFGKHVHEMDDFSSSSIGSRVEDLHDAFADPRVHLLHTVIGGFNTNQLFRHLDYDLIRQNPKILCGFSDITALANAIYAKTGLVTYSGPHFFNFGMKYGFEYTLDYFKRCLLSDEPIQLEPAAEWSDDRWAIKQDEREFIRNDGYWILNEGKANGTIIGGNLCTFNLLHGTEFMPGLENTILFLEDDDESKPHTFDRDLQSLIHQPGFNGVRGIVIGRFERTSQVTRDLLQQIIDTKEELQDVPVIGNVDFGHTSPLITFPIGGEASIQVSNDQATVIITKH
jgi:muramoyltetrapeptide carboxypeptidase